MSVKWDQIINKGGEIFRKVQWNVEKYATPGGGLRCDPVQWGYWKDQSTQSGSGVCKNPSRDMFQTDDKNTLNNGLNQKI